MEEHSLVSPDSHLSAQWEPAFSYREDRALMVPILVSCGKYQSGGSGVLVGLWVSPRCLDNTRRHSKPVRAGTWTRSGVGNPGKIKNWLSRMLGRESSVVTTCTVMTSRVLLLSTITVVQPICTPAGATDPRPPFLPGEAETQAPGFLQQSVCLSLVAAEILRCDLACVFLTVCQRT